MLTIVHNPFRARLIYVRQSSLKLHLLDRLLAQNSLQFSLGKRLLRKQRLEEIRKRKIRPQTEKREIEKSESSGESSKRRSLALCSSPRIRSNCEYNRVSRTHRTPRNCLVTASAHPACSSGHSVHPVHLVSLSILSIWLLCPSCPSFTHPVDTLTYSSVRRNITVTRVHCAVSCVLFASLTGPVAIKTDFFISH